MDGVRLELEKALAIVDQAETVLGAYRHAIEVARSGLAGHPVRALTVNEAKARLAYADQMGLGLNSKLILDAITATQLGMAAFDIELKRRHVILGETWLPNPDPVRDQEG